MSKKVEFKGAVTAMSETDTEHALKFINKCKYCVLGTIDDEKGVHLSILTTQDKQELAQIWYVTPTSTRKVRNLKKDSRCEVLYTDNDNQISLFGRGEIITDDVELKKEIASLWARLYVPEGPESPEMSLIRFVPETINAIVK